MNTPASSPTHDGAATPRGGARHLLLLTLGAMGVVYGDIGTSPLYAMRECFFGAHSVPPSENNIMGVLSLLFWTLTIIVSFKYILIVLRADNRGEGGGMAQLALITKLYPRNTDLHRHPFILMGIFGAALVYGDGAITPAISVLSAVEGLTIATPVFQPLVMPLSLAILVALFLVQKHGTGRIGRVFGPIILVWFLTIAILGVRSILNEPRVLWSLHPAYGFEFLRSEGAHAFLSLGSVFLAVTGAEALYADMGHFGRSPIRLGWLAVAFPSLVLNYLGQGALLLNDPTAARNPFYLLAPEGGLYPLVFLATCATIIASQALISGAFSITRQAVQLGYLPRLQMLHTSSEEIGQIYVPLVNWMLLGAVIWLVLTFHNADQLANAYGVAVAATMIVTTILTMYVARNVWKWPLLPVLLLLTFLLGIDLAFFTSNITKIPAGGWFPLVLGAVIFLIMTTWHRGRVLLAERLRSILTPTDHFIEQIASFEPHRLPGTAVFMARSLNAVPSALFHNVRHNRVLHERVLLLTVDTEDIPHVPTEDQIAVEPLGQGFYRVMVHYGFMDTPNILDALSRLTPHGIDVDLNELTFYLSRETIVATPLPGMAMWRERLFAFMSRNAERAATFFRIPSKQVMEIGQQIDL